MIATRSRTSVIPVSTTRNHPRSCKYTIGIARETIVHFNSDALSVRDKLRLASIRKATVEEDMAYSLIGVFKSDIRPHYGEGDIALGHLLEEIVGRSGDVTVLASAWAGKSSPYNSCLPASLAVYSQTPRASPAIKGANMDERVAALRDSLPREDVMLIHNRVITLPPARFANRRLHLPSIIFAVKNLSVPDFGSGIGYHYHARAARIGDVEFQTSDRLSLSELRRLVFVHPWMCDLRDPFDGFSWGNTTVDDDDDDDDKSNTDPEITEPRAVVGSESAPNSTSPLHAVVTRASAPTDDHTHALRLVVRLQQPFHVLLLQQQPNGEFRRVTVEREIFVPGIERAIHVVCTGVIEIL